MPDAERLLESLKAARAEVVRAEAGVKIGSEVYLALEKLRAAVDDLAGAVSGDRELFWPKPHKAC